MIKNEFDPNHNRLCNLARNLALTALPLEDSAASDPKEEKKEEINYRKLTKASVSVFRRLRDSGLIDASGKNAAEEITARLAEGRATAALFKPGQLVRSRSLFANFITPAEWDKLLLNESCHPAATIKNIAAAIDCSREPTMVVIAPAGINQLATP